MIHLGPGSELLATVGAVAGGGAVLGSLIGGTLAVVSQNNRTELVETAAAFGIFFGLAALLVFVVEQTGLL